MKKFISIVFSLVLLASFQAGASAEGYQKYMAKFVYDPPVQSLPMKDSVVFAQTKVFFKSNNPFNLFASDQLAGLGEAVNGDIEGIIAAKGFKNKGSYNSVDLITFQEKKAIDLLLTPWVELSFSVKDITEKGGGTFFKPATIQTGKAVVSGNLTVETREPASRELMWIKTIPWHFEFFFSYNIGDFTPTYRKGVLASYEPVLDALAREFENRYPDIMGNLYSLIDPEEMSLIGKQAREIKAKSGY